MFVIIILAIVYALTIHEFSHSFAATYLGDNTSKFNGRLTLNPMAHLDLFGTLMLLFAGFGWGKPVPVNPYNLRFQRWGGAIVSLAGPMSNFLSVILFAIIFMLLFPNLDFGIVVAQVFSGVGFYESLNMTAAFISMLIFVNLILGIFNLIPIPPLDGSKVLFAFLPPRYDDFKRKLTVNGPWILLALIFLDRYVGEFNLLGNIFYFFVNAVDKIV
ncbi:site-2 protease family protein [Candidatus Parcubacteria bacterium]|nr:site-2 protease family protein [Candidatus Parcubacteria bacterium]MBT7228966.1 site-2 protease family protein [Candidatus Parcubacteria bacterium]